eukprot:15366349-Ditylum_brightwellii.AAC.1
MAAISLLIAVFMANMLLGPLKYAVLDVAVVVVLAAIAMAFADNHHHNIFNPVVVVWITKTNMQKSRTRQNNSCFDCAWLLRLRQMHLLSM